MLAAAPLRKAGHVEGKGGQRLATEQARAQAGRARRFERHHQRALGGRSRYRRPADPDDQRGVAPIRHAILLLFARLQTRLSGP